MNGKKQYEVTFGNHIAELGKLRDEAREKKSLVRCS
jgi:hypothetical protein